MRDRDRPAILLTGANGQVGWELARTLAPLGSVVAHDRTTLNLEDLDSLRSAVRAIQPAIIVNAAAYTHVDRAEAEVGLAYRVNAEAPGVLAEEAARSGALLVHYSTDYVFDGLSKRAYCEHDEASPVNAYGRTKLAGEKAVLESGAAAYVFRLSWVYGLRGTNFFRTIRRRAAEASVLQVVVDQVGTPTWSRLVAEVTASALTRLLQTDAAGQCPAPGVYHVAAPDSTTWFEFATAILDTTKAAGSTVPRIEAITSAQRASAAPRPPNSVLNSRRLFGEFGLSIPPWREQLDLCVKSL